MVNKGITGVRTSEIDEHIVSIALDPIRIFGRTRTCAPPHSADPTLA